jgi:hypothetical protein
MRAPLGAGIESTRLYHNRKPMQVDTADLTFHSPSPWAVKHGVVPKYPEDLALAKSAGMRLIRYGIPWWKCERKEGEIDFEPVRAQLLEILRLGLDPIIDLNHHTCHPSWMTLGIADPRYVEASRQFALALKKEFPWLKKFTPFNEPTATTFLSVHFGKWPPFWTVKGWDDPEKTKLEVQSKLFPVVEIVVKSILLIAEDLQRVDPEVEIWWVDTCEYHQAPHNPSFEWELNERRFLFMDLVLGNGRNNGYLRKFGFGEDFIEWAVKHQLKGTVVWGLDYYSHSERKYYQRFSRAPSPNPIGMVQVAQQYWERCGRKPIWISEINIRGTIFARLTWMKLMFLWVEDLERLGLDIRMVCLFPMIDSVTWAHYAMRWCRRRDPTGGLVHLSPDLRTREVSIMTEVVSAIGNRTMTPAEMPQYLFEPLLAKSIRGFWWLMAGRGWNDQAWQQQPNNGENGEDRRKKNQSIPIPDI